uniref:Putative his-rich 1 n=1 Tax=Rhipicephalus microplus TaxID=6941 RepID=A0A6M2D6L9_RHIMP
MKVTAVFLACAILTASAGIQDLCDYNIEQLSLATTCIKRKASFELKVALAETKAQVQCINDSCAIRKLCQQGKLADVLPLYYTGGEIWELEDLLEECRPWSPQEDSSVLIHS